MATREMSDDAAALLAFYSGSGRDEGGRTLRDVRSMSEEQLESSHDYVQWLFPLLERSRAVPSAPVMDQNGAAAFRANPALRRELRESLFRMLRFYGLEAREGTDEWQIERGPAFRERSRVWLSPGNHNFLRLTRIMKSLVLLGEGELARALLGCLEGIHDENAGVIGATTLAFWRDAVEPSER
jgi:hypothetical protein